MMFPSRPSNSFLHNPSDLLFSVLENTEVGLVVLDAAGRTVFMNASARNLLACPTGIIPAELEDNLAGLREQLRRSPQAIEKWQHADMILRVRARQLDRNSDHTVLEVTLEKAAGNRAVAEQLSRGLNLSISDARLLALLWRGMSNDEIADMLNVRVGTVKSRLFRLYQKLGVKRRPAAVLRAAEVLQ
jgi:ATP/maltotriose-dependent transcriptional regulator MalT